MYCTLNLKILLFFSFFNIYKMNLIILLNQDEKKFKFKNSSRKKSFIRDFATCEKIIVEVMHTTSFQIDRK